MKQIEVCLSPDLIHLHSLQNKIVVVVDILRATSCITTGLAHGIASITPLQDLEKCRKMKEQGYIIAGERNGEKVNGFDLGNSPFHFMDPSLKGKKIALTTTNGTIALEKSREALEILAGAFLNITSISDYLKDKENDVLILCAGWKGRVNLEDTLFAGALITKLGKEFNYEDDAALTSYYLFEYSKPDLLDILKRSSHVRRLKRLNIEKDIEFCLHLDEFSVIPRVDADNKIIASGF